jgi:DNA-binding XRE family transcriptional regulator
MDAVPVTVSAFKQGPRSLSHLARVRVLRGHTQASLADAVGCSKRTICRLEKGGTPSATTAIRISHALGHTDPLVVFPELRGTS